MGRLTKEELAKLMEAEGCDRIWSWSKVNCFATSPYEYFLKYILHEKEDRQDCIYTTTGSLCHEILEKYYTGLIDYDKMIKLFDNGWAMAYGIAQLKFDRNDEEKNEKIAEKYYNNLIHFFENHKVMQYKPMIEKFVKIKINGSLFQGYIDCAFKDDDDNVHIVDFKSSSIYKGAKAEKECGQLVLYAIGVSQHGIPMDKIRICWNFLKYCTIQYEQKNGAIKTRDVERHKVGESLQNNARMWLKTFGYTDEETDSYLMELLDNNDIGVLPEEVQEKYSMDDCYVYVPLTEELVNGWIDKITSYISTITKKESLYEKTKNERLFWDDDDSVNMQSYYFATLCGYSANLHKPYKQYLDRLKSSRPNLFGGVSNSYKKKEDLSWLDNLPSLS